MDRAWVVVSFGLALACGPALVVDATGPHGGSDSAAAETGAGVDTSGVRDPTTDGVDVSSEGSSDGSSDPSDPWGSTGGTTGAPVPIACTAAEWDESYATFQALTEAADDRYWYASRRAVYVDGFTPDCYFTTTVEVADGVVVRRVLDAAEPTDGGATAGACAEPPFDEIGDAVGSHDVAAAGPVWTLDELYAGCCADVLSIEPADEYFIDFSTFPTGVIQSCSAIGWNCVDGGCEAGPSGFGDGSLVSFQLGALPD